MCETDEFIPVFEEKELKDGSMEELLVQEIPVLLFKVNGEIFVTSGQCPHLGAPFNIMGWDGRYNIRCGRGFCSNMGFDIRTGMNLDYPEEEEIVLQKFDFKIKEGQIFIKIK